MCMDQGSIGRGRMKIAKTYKVLKEVMKILKIEKYHYTFIVTHTDQIHVHDTEASWIKEHWTEGIHTEVSVTLKYTEKKGQPRIPIHRHLSPERRKNKEISFSWN